MNRYLYAILMGGLLAAVSPVAVSADRDISNETRLAMLSVTPRTAHDLKAVTYIENAHGQLNEWGDRFVARLERNLGPRLSDPLIDGRARFQVQKLRITYTRYADSQALKKAINALADAHAARLDVLEKMLETGVVERGKFAAATKIVHQRIQDIRNWSKK